jgi:hypothetical protein
VLSTKIWNPEKSEKSFWQIPVGGRFFLANEKILFNLAKFWQILANLAKFWQILVGGRFFLAKMKLCFHLAKFQSLYETNSFKIIQM